MPARPWRPPRTDRVPDTTCLDGLLEYGEDRDAIVPVSRIFGLDPGANNWNPDWTLREEELRDDPDLLRYHREKLDSLMKGDARRHLPPITEEALVEGLGPKFRTLHLIEIDGLFFIGSGGIHRVAAAKQLGFARLKAVVTHASFTPDASEAARRWVAAFRPDR